MSTPRRCRNSRSLSPPKTKNVLSQDPTTCERCEQQLSSLEEKKKKKESSGTRTKALLTKPMQEQTKVREDCRYAGSVRRNSAPRVSYASNDSRSLRQANLVFSKHEKEKIKMQGTIDKLQDAFCEKESKLQDARSQLIRERRMSELMERQLKNSRNLSEQLGRIIHDREQEIRTLKNTLNKKQDSRTLGDVQPGFKTNSRQGDRRKNSRDDFQTTIRRSSSTSEHSECNTLSSSSVDKMLKEVHSLVEGLKIKDEAIKGLQEECTRRLDKIQTLQRSLQILQDKLTKNSQHHSNVCSEKDAILAQLQHNLREAEATVESLLSEKTKVVQEGEMTINELQQIIHERDLSLHKVQLQLQEVLESKENEVNKLKSNLERQQTEIELKQKSLEEVSEELYSNQMEAEALKMELGKEKCSMNQMSEEINSLMDKMSRAVAEMETTKIEYQKKDEKLRMAQANVKDLYLSFFGDHILLDKIQSMFRRKRLYTGRNVLSDEDVIPPTIRNQQRGSQLFQFENRYKNNPIGMSNNQIHKQQLAELQQQVTESQSVCGILQEQLKEVTDFLDQLLHIEISPKNLSALSVFRQYGKHLPDPAMMLSISKERIAPDGVSSNSQLDIETSKKRHHGNNNSRNTQIDTPRQILDARHGSCDNLKYYHQNQYHDALNRNNLDFVRSISAEEVQPQNPFPDDCQIVTTTWDQTEEDDQLDDTCSESDEIILLINDKDATNGAEGHHRKMARPHATSSPPFQHGLVVKENYGSTGSINTRDKETYPSLERSASFGSFSGSVLMSYDQSEKASNEDSGLMRSRCVRSIDMMDIIQVGHPGIGVGLSSDTDIWSEPDMGLSRQRMGIGLDDSEASSKNESSLVSNSSESYHRKRRYGVQLKGDTPKRNVKGFWHHPVRKYASKLKRWLERLKCYLRVFEEASYNLTDELNNLCQLRTDLLAVIATCSANQRVENLDIILSDVAEYIRLNYLLQGKIERAIHYNRQLIDASGKNVSRRPKKIPDNHVLANIPTTNNDILSDRLRIPPLPLISQPDPPTAYPVYENQQNQDTSDIQSQLVGYHTTLLSCQDMIKDLHSQLKERHCSELMNKHELNRTVYGYLEDIDTCIEELCKKMENTGESLDTQDIKQSYESLLDDQNRLPYPAFSNVLTQKLKENEDRLLRFEELLTQKEQQLKSSADDAVQLEMQLNSIKQSLYEIQVENLELKECLEFSESKQIEIEDSSSQMLRDLQMTMQRLSELEERFRCIDEATTEQKSEDEEEYVQDNVVENTPYPVEYEYHQNSEWQEEEEEDDVDIIDPPDTDQYAGNW